MLHEILLALSGHPSPLFPATSGETNQRDKFVDKDFPLLSPSEAALLETIGRLASLHRQIRAHAGRISSEHPSTICRAVAWSVVHTHLARFREKILGVEKQILTKDSAIVGAYNIVPLSAVVGEFDDWNRRMQWYWDLVCFVQPPGATKYDQATGAGVIDHLRTEINTGFPDIETAATELSRIAEKAWLKQASVWLLYGVLPSHGAVDFFVTVEQSIEGSPTYVLRRELLPRFVSRQTAGSLLFIGKSLHQVKQHKQASSKLQASETAEDASLISVHLQSLSSLSLPLIPAAFSTTISSIRSSLSQKVLQRLLPLHEIELALSTLRQIFLLDRGEFAITLITEAQARLDARRDQVRLLHDPPSKNLHNVLIKEGEISETLSQTWKALSHLQISDPDDEILDFARANIHLSLQAPNHSRPSTSDGTTPAETLSNTSFNDLLFPVKTHLTMTITSPLDLFISKADITTYSSISAYLLALRRAHTRLSSLWLLTHSRRENPLLLRDPIAKHRSLTRNASQRKVWATCSAAVFLLSETTAYFEGEIIKGSWDGFLAWVIKGTEGRAHDPETLGRAHRCFLQALGYALLLTDAAYTKSLRILLDCVDALVSAFTRLQRLNATREFSMADEILLLPFKEEEAQVEKEVDRARKRVDGALKDVVGRLRELDHERLWRGSSHC